MNHPWELTLDRFIAHAQEAYGLRLSIAPSGELGSRWPLSFRVLRSADGSIKVVLPEIDPDEAMPFFLLESLVRQLGLPREDFGLDPE